MQPLFTDSFLSHHLANFKLSSVPNIRTVRDLIKGLIQELESGKLESLKEEEVGSRFINDFFGNILGFNCGNSNFWTLREEVKTKVDGTKPDGALGYFYKNKEEDDIRAIIEVKDAKTDLDLEQKRIEKKSPVSQAFEYSQKMGEKCDWVIVTNCKEVRFYLSKYRGKSQVFLLKELSNEEKLKELLFLFHKDRFIKKDSSSKTQQLYKINSFKLKENEKSRHIVDEIHSSLISFKGLNYVDPNYIASIKPFNILKEYVWHYNNNNLLTINPKIHYLFRNLKFDNGNIIVSKELKKDLEDSEVIEYNEKIEYFIKFLNHSQITEINCIEDYQSIIKSRSETLGFSHKHHFHFSKKDGFTKNIDILKYNPCDCISCNFNSFDFKHLLSKLKTAKYKDDLQTLEYAYGNYLVSTNNYKESYYIYKKLSEKIKGKEGYEVEYFLAKTNMKYLLYLVLEDEKLKDSFQIKREIRHLDLDKVLYDELEYNITDDVRNYLIKIKEEKLLSATQDKVEDLTEKTINLKKLYDRGGVQTSGSTHINELANQYYNLQLHLNKNRIIYNVFQKYQLLTAKVFNGFIDSYLTKNRGISAFNSYYLIEFISNISPTLFQKTLLRIDDIKLNEGSDQKLVQNITNLLKSYYDDGVFANTAFKNKITEEYMLDYQFNDKYRALVTNSFTLLTKIDLRNETFASLSNIIITFLSVEDNLAWYEIKEFENLLIKKGDFFTSEQLMKILKLAIERDKPNNNKYQKLIENTSKSLNKFYPDIKTNNKQLIKKAIGNINRNFKYYSYLLLISDDECSNILNKEIEDFLDEKLDFDFYSHLITNKLYDFNKKDYFSKYVLEINNSKRKGFLNKFKDGKPVFEDYRFYYFIVLLNILEIDSNHESLKALSNLSDYEKWLIKPREYDYANFNSNWVLASTNRYILKSLKGIEQLNKAVEAHLKNEFNPILSEIYYSSLL